MKNIIMNQRTEKKGGNLSIIIFISAIALLFIVYIGGLIFLKKTGTQAKEYIGDFTPQTLQLADGIYKGQYEIMHSRTAADIEFTIADGKVISITLHKLFHTPMYPLPKKIKPAIEESRDLKFEAITGATVSSFFVKAAIKNAFNNRTEE
jgi:uncharacterized protein with FMN-binding domain